MTVVLSANTSWYLWNFRRHLIQALLSEGYRVVLIVPEDDFTEKLRSLSVTLKVIQISGQGRNPLREFRLFCRYLRLLDRRTHCFLGFTIKPVLYGGVACRLLGIPSIPTITGLGSVFIKEFWWQGLIESAYRFALAASGVVVFQNSDDRDLFIGKKIVTRGQPKIVGGSGVDLEEFPLTPLPEFKDSGAPVRFLMVSRMLIDKGVCEFIDAARIVLERGRNATFLLVGPLDETNPGSVRKKVLDSAVRENVIENMPFQEDMLSLLIACDCFVLPSYREGLPRSVLEAAAVGRPVITTDTAGCRRAVNHEESGLICRPRDVESLVDALEKMLEKTFHDRRQMGIAGRRRVEHEFSVARVVQDYQEEIRNLVA